MNIHSILSDIQYLYGLYTEKNVFFKFDLPDDFFQFSG